MTGFDLRREPWIPCLDDNGMRQMSLVEVLTDAHKIRELVGETPPITIALHRLLLAILHRIHKGPKNAEAWNDLYTRGKFDAEKIEEYFDRFEDRFDLFHEKYPFYQTASAREHLQNGAAIQLYFQGKNNATLFEHTSTSMPKKLSPAEAARLLIAFQGFDFGGLKADGPGAQTAPLLQSAVALVRGTSLFETLMFNLHRYDGKNAQPFVFDEEADMPAWERLEEVHKKERWPDGPVDLLTWQTRKLAIGAFENESRERIIKDAVIMHGFVFVKDVALHSKETMMAYYTTKKGDRRNVEFYDNRSLWRNSLSLFQNVPNQSTRPRTLTWLSDLMRGNFLARRRIPVDFYGMVADKSTGGGKLVSWHHDRFDLPVEYIEDSDLMADLGICLDFAEEVGSAVRAGMKRLADELQTDRTTFFAEANYWSAMETRFHNLLNRLPSDTETEMRAWFADTLQIAIKAFRDSLNSLSGTAAEVQASVKAENMLWGVISKSVKAGATNWNKYLPDSFAAKGGNS